MLIPRLLGRKKYLLYLGCVAALLAGTAQLNSFISATRSISFYRVISLSPTSVLQLVQFGFVYLAITTLLKLSRAWFKLLESKNHLIRLEREKAIRNLLFLKMPAQSALSVQQLK